MLRPANGCDLTSKMFSKCGADLTKAARERLHPTSNTFQPDKAADSFPSFASAKNHVCSAAPHGEGLRPITEVRAKHHTMSLGWLRPLTGVQGQSRSAPRVSTQECKSADERR